MELMNFQIEQLGEKKFEKFRDFPKKNLNKRVTKSFEWAYNKTTTAIDSTNHYLPEKTWHNEFHQEHSEK